ncbi:MAG TPA: hypothetical protein VKC59_03935, partial [Candidatus Limnocylindrales bacterium]|nr:hypothetical protein [Candidatus Limnocylindrales bacterium]
MTTTDVASTADTRPAVLEGPAAFPPLGSVTAEAMARLNDWVVAASQAHKLVAPLVDSAFIPEAYKPKLAPNASDEDRAYARQVAIANATSAVLLGLNLGVDPLTALQQIYLVKGRPGMYAKMKVALLMSRGYEVWTESLTDDEAVVCGRRAGSDRVEKITITMAMARKAGWTSSEMYAKTPQDMLWARAAGRVCDRLGAAVLMGLPSVEDIPDTIQVEATVGPRRTVGDILPAAAAAERAPTEPDQPPAAPEPERVTLPPSDAELRRMFALLKDVGITDKAESLTFVGGVADRTIASRSELTRDEVRMVSGTVESMKRVLAQ